MLHCLSCGSDVKEFLTIGSAGECEAGEDPQEGHGSIISGLCELAAFIQPGSDMIGRDRRGHLIRQVNQSSILECSGLVFAEFNRVASKNLEGQFYEALDQHTPRFIELFKSKKGTTGQKLTELMQHINLVSPDVMALRSVVLKGLPIVLGDDSSEVYKTCFDTAKEEALASVTIGVLTVVNEDAEQQGLNAVHLQPISTAIILEGSTVMDNGTKDPAFREQRAQDIRVNELRQADTESHLV
ncbi:hypothetical protein L3Q82_008393 [Scortum barcoo]|uniref:Uncharacterized protein n=1 Tax=Scortum barcoo TaxID=214431 RepID=A0ACB8XAN9_9TELE|nr:hypothetical protein L3Q82_008393 [Scortum barcoo]